MLFNLLQMLPTGMFNALSNLVFMPFSASAGPDLSAATAPIIGILNSVFTAAIPVVGALGSVYCIFLGVKLAKADEQQERDKAKNALKNAIIGFVAIFVLVVVLNQGIKILGDWMTQQI